MKKLEKVRLAGQLALRNPKLFLSYARYRLKRLSPAWRNLNLETGVRNFDGVAFEVDFKTLGVNHFTKQIFFGHYEIALVEAMKRVLRPGDTFFDAGANVGYLTAVGTSIVGTTGQVHSFEPTPLYSERIRRFASMNPGHRVVVNAVALGDRPGKIRMEFLRPPYCGGSTAVAGLTELQRIPREFIETIDVPMVRLDDYIREHAIERVSAIKIDVEGFEFQVLKGLENYLRSRKHRPVIFCEITPPYAVLGSTREDIKRFMDSYGYQAFDVMDPSRPMDFTKAPGAVDVIFRCSSDA